MNRPYEEKAEPMGRGLRYAGLALGLTAMVTLPSCISILEINGKRIIPPIPKTKFEKRAEDWERKYWEREERSWRDSREKVKLRKKKSRR